MGFWFRVWGTGKGRGRGRMAEAAMEEVLRTHRFCPDVQIAAKGKKRLAVNTGRPMRSFVHMGQPTCY